ncbi:Cytidyltransferase-related domain protein [Desulfamplus magnetovallimortis]|uniref:Cytidyltransferase-related domain protein n=1 Tax=Desulfamplus magnetovallimortis TaxID=1246637 RepID=A0A1W1HEH2_9BACT|nr:PfkB family carbohydrate kinase [Desulfamplus magnetovallimortis]SLM30901.1 Cytidyltransferase-related domain protein [Desulfamplus magnetovallimortis]
MSQVSKKILTLNELSIKIQELKLKKFTIVHCHGVFDLLHIGHIRYFKHAKNMGDILVVTLTPDRYVDKGPHRPAFPEQLRVEAVASLDYVDFVALNLWDTAEKTLQKILPNVYVKGSEFKIPQSDPTGKMGREAKICEQIKCRLTFTDDIIFSSTNLINRYFSSFSSEIQGYLSFFKKRHSIEKINFILNRMKELKILIVGDAIIDDYHYCEALGKSSKDPILALQYKSNDMFAGGACAVANHLAEFSRSVTLLTVLGENDSHETFIKSRLKNNILPIFIEKPDRCTPLKRRFIDCYSTNKLFEVCFLDSTPLTDDRDTFMAETICQASMDCDLVVVSDFGHGAVGTKCVETLNNLQKPVAVNTQANAANRGFNTISKYPGKKMACIAEHELRLECRDDRTPVRPLIERLASRLELDMLIVTRGHLGCEIYSSDIPEFISVPSFITRVTDRIGAGDAFLSMAAMGYALKLEPELSGFLGIIMGSLAIGVIGNQKPITESEIKAFITSLLK